MKEVKSVVFSFNACKAPGPDGFPSAFFQEFWDIVKDDVVIIVRDFLKRGKMLKQVNSTFIILIPKKEQVEELIEFQPISICSVFYKIISKVIVN